MKRSTIVKTTKAAVAIPVGLSVGAVAWNIAEAVAPPQIKLPLKVARAVGCVGIGSIVGHASDKMFDEVFDPIEKYARMKDDLEALQKENEELKKKNIPQVEAEIVGA